MHVITYSWINVYPCLVNGAYGFIPFPPESNLIAALVQGTHVNIKLRGLPVTMPDAEVRSVLLEMRNLHTRRFLMLLSTAGGRKLLTLARRLGMTAKPNSWIMLNLVSNATDTFD